MKQRERSVRRWVGSIALLWLMLLGSAGHAATAVQSAGPATYAAMTSTTQWPATTDMFDCTPCVACYVAPVPSLHGFGGEPREPDESSWPIQDLEIPRTAGPLDHGGRRTRMPARIAFCRWLD
jgi:hypothetical protein